MTTFKNSDVRMKRNSLWWCKCQTGAVRQSERNYPSLAITARMLPQGSTRPYTHASIMYWGQLSSASPATRRRIFTEAQCSSQPSKVKRDRATEVISFSFHPPPPSSFSTVHSNYETGAIWLPATLAYNLSTIAYFDLVLALEYACGFYTWYSSKALLATFLFTIVIQCWSEWQGANPPRASCLEPRLHGL